MQTPQAPQSLPPDYDFSQCFGIPAFSLHLDPECYLCPYTHSCDWAAHNRNTDGREGHVSYERFGYSREIAAAPEQTEERNNGEDVPEYSRRDMVELLAFLLRIDEYTIKLLSEIVTDSQCTAAALARKEGVSRQSIHQKLRRAVKLYPEIGELIRAHLYRCRRVVRDGISERQRHPERGTSKQAPAPAKRAPHELTRTETAEKEAARGYQKPKRGSRKI